MTLSYKAKLKIFPFKNMQLQILSHPALKELAISIDPFSATITLQTPGTREKNCLLRVRKTCRVNVITRTYSDTSD